jgi:hypothetical protein
LKPFVKIIFKSNFSSSSWKCRAVHQTDDDYRFSSSLPLLLPQPSSYLE